MMRMSCSDLRKPVTGTVTEATSKIKKTSLLSFQNPCVPTAYRGCFWSSHYVKCNMLQSHLKSGSCHKLWAISCSSSLQSSWILQLCSLLPPACAPWSQPGLGRDGEGSLWGAIKELWAGLMQEAALPQCGWDLDLCFNAVLRILTK